MGLILELGLPQVGGLGRATQAKVGGLGRAT